MPSWAARPVPTSSAVGVARPRAQGQAITSTATAAVKPPVRVAEQRPRRRRSPPRAPSTTGTNTAETRSASRCTGALVGLGVPDQVGDPGDRGVAADAGDLDDQPARGVQGARRRPRRRRDLSTGTLSPVSIDSSTPELPSSTTPSVATCSPGRTRNRMPGRSRPTSTSRSVPSSSSRVASCAPSASSSRRADPARCLARASLQRPSSRKVVTVAATSK